MPEDVLKLHRLTVTQPGEPLIAALATAIPGLTKTQARRAVLGGLVKVDGAVAGDATGALGDTHRIEVDLRHGVDRAYKARVHGGNAAISERPMEVLWSDHRLVVVNKAPGILAAPGKADPGGRVERGHVPELLRRILHKQGRKIGFMGIIHRLDKDTSGCLILAFDHEAQRMVSEQFSTHSAARTYHALVENHPHGDDGVIRGKQGRRDGRRVLVDEDEPGVEAVTRWKVLKRYPLGTAIEATLETGRTHQIRVALNSLGCPVWGDRVYRDRRWRVPAAQAPRLMLHAHKLAFDHPDDGRRVEVVAPIPPVFGEFAAVLDKPALRTS